MRLSLMDSTRARFQSCFLHNLLCGYVKESLGKIVAPIAGSEELCPQRVVGFDVKGGGRRFFF